MMKKRIKFRGAIRLYMQWPVLLIVMLAAMNVCMYLVDIGCGVLMTFFVLIYAVLVLYLYFHNRQLFINEMINFAVGYGQIQKKLLKELSLPYALLDDTGKVIWMNNAFCDVTGKSRNYKKSITNIFPSITKDRLPSANDTSMTEIHLENGDYRVQMQKIMMENIAEADNIFETTEYEGYLVALYLFDETDLNYFMRINKEQQLVVGLLYIDNYEEALEGVEEVRQSLLTALIERKITKYITAAGGLVKKFEKDKYFVVLQNVHLDALCENRFDLLDDIKNVSVGNEIAVTLSIGIGADGSSYSQNLEFARNAIDLALGRGGDQAVVKHKEKIAYYGGKSKQVEKSTRVKARVKAHALRELIQSKEKVFVMGHKLGDTDSFGAAIGIYRATKLLNKRAYIVINDITTSVRVLIEGFMNNLDYEEDMFLTSEEALDMVDNSSMLVTVDVNKPSLTECPELLTRCKTIVVLDHHRQGTESIDSAVLSYVEPYASSACEMVAEILQYIGDNIRVPNLEADCMYSGIMIDTNNFMTKTGVRTFEAAAFLRRSGADVTRVRKLFRENMDVCKAKADSVLGAEMYKGHYAIAECPAEGLESPTVVGAQTANELLNITSVRASFVLTAYNGKIYISARSIDEVTVQLIMERLGGGGHLNLAGAQLETSMGEAIATLKQTIDEMEAEDAI